MGLQGPPLTRRSDREHRQRLLGAYRILDTPAEQSFDDLTAVAAQLCAAPIALVSLIAEDRQWFKARVGIDPQETPIEQSVCAHDLDQPGILEIPDLTRDPRTRDNPLVTGPPFPRFYAGAPLVARDGTAIGRLCVLDIAARPAGLNEGQRAALEALARVVMVQIELRNVAEASDADAAAQRAIGNASMQRAALTDSENARLRSEGVRFRAAQQAGRIGTFEVDVPSGMMLVSREFCEIFGLPVAPSYHSAAVEALAVVEDRAQMSSVDTRADGSADRDVEYRINRADDDAQRWISRRASFTHDAAGQVVLMHGTVHDVTERRELQAQQDVLNQEISHRLKNTLMMVQAIALQTFRQVPDRAPVDAFERRLLALGTAHDILLQDDWRSAEILPAAAAVLAQLGQSGRVALSGPMVRLSSRVALSFTLLVHELATNAMKYGALSNDAGRVTLDWRIEGDELVVRWREAGGPAVEGPPERKGFGSRLIRAGLVGTGGVQLRYERQGLYAELRAPLDLIEQS